MSRSLVVGGVATILLGGGGSLLIADAHTAAAQLAFNRINIVNSYVPDGTRLGQVNSRLVLILSNNVHTPDLEKKTMMICVDYQILNFVPFVDRGTVCVEKNLYRPPAAPKPRRELTIPQPGDLPLSYEI